MEFKFLPISNKKQIGSKRSYDDIKFIVIHYTANFNKGADAMAHYRYLQHAQRYGSAHYYVDDKEIVQVIGDSFVAWSVADNQGYGKFLNGCNNSNSISIEMCVNSDANMELVYKNTLELTKNLMKKFNINANHVCRHYDVSRKKCPAIWSKNNWEQWWKFKEEIKQPIEWVINLSESSSYGISQVNDKTPLNDKLERVEGNDGKIAFIVKVFDEIKGVDTQILKSVTIAQAILESGWGKSELALKANNLFGIKNSLDWQGKVYTISTKEYYSGKIEIVNAEFRMYDSFRDSIIDHDKFFTSTSWRTKNYERVLKAKNYKEQAQALKDCGYATDPKYADKLISLIEEYKLYNFDGVVDLKDTNNVSEWAKDGYDFCVKSGISDGTNPKSNCTREEVMVMIYRLYNLLKEEEDDKSNNSDGNGFRYSTGV